MKKHVSVIIVLWLLATSTSYVWGIHTNTSQSRDNAVKIGRAFFKLITISRDWNASHGGVYVPTTFKTQPNPYLPTKSQTLDCANNQQLTLINPAIMTAHLSNLALKSEGLSFRLISTAPINPENKANKWEAQALNQFSKTGLHEATNFTTINGRTILNYIAPLHTKTECLKCHNSKKYRLGDTIGGISLATPLNVIKTSKAFIISHISAALFGTIILLFYGIRLHRNQQLLIRAKTKAEQASLAKSNFLATMSHELRTPLSGIIGMTGIIGKKDLTNDLRQPLQDIRSSAESLLIIINDILDFSKLEINKLTLNKEPFQLAKLCKECIRLIAPLAENKNLEFRYDLDETIPKWLNGDQLRLRQIILNLLQNSVKFTSTGSVHLKVTLQSESIKKTFIKFSISDTGIGISQNEQEKLFRPYQQAGTNTASRYGGTGLGLFICKQLTSLMNGNIRVESSKQTGSTFYFTVELDKTITPPEKKNKPFTSLPTKHTKSILLAEDSAINRKVLKKILSDYGYTCTCVNNGQEALNLATVNQYDIIILDSRMDKLNGPMACIEIRKTLYGATTPILALTADITQQEHGLCFEAGMDDVIIKPVDPTALLMTIDQLIANTELSSKGASSKP